MELIQMNTLKTINQIAWIGMKMYLEKQKIHIRVQMKQYL